VKGEQEEEREEEGGRKQANKGREPREGDKREEKTTP
jgi:hypothetical protein